MELDAVYLALTLFGEVRGENDFSRHVIAWIIRNRVTHTKGKRTYQDIVQKPAQFSCWGSKDKNYPLIKDPRKSKISDVKAWEELKIIAKEVISSPESKNPIPELYLYFSGPPNVKKNPWQKDHFKIDGVPNFNFSHAQYG